MWHACMQCTALLNSSIQTPATEATRPLMASACHREYTGPYSVSVPSFSVATRSIGFGTWFINTSTHAWPQAHHSGPPGRAGARHHVAHPVVVEIRSRQVFTDVHTSAMHVVRCAGWTCSTTRRMDLGSPRDMQHRAADEISCHGYPIVGWLCRSPQVQGSPVLGCPEEAPE